MLRWQAYREMEIIHKCNSMYPGDKNINTYWNDWLMSGSIRMMEFEKKNGYGMKYFSDTEKYVDHDATLV